MLWHCWLGVRKSIRPVKIERWAVGVVISLERGADCLHMVQLMPLHPKTRSSLASIATLVSPFWYRLTQVVLKRPLNECSISSSGGRQSWLYVTFWCTLNIPYWTVSCTVMQNSQLQFTGWLCFPQYYTVLQKLHQLQTVKTLTNINLFWHTMFRSCTFFCKKTQKISNAATFTCWAYTDRGTSCLQCFDAVGWSAGSASGL